MAKYVKKINRCPHCGEALSFDEAKTISDFFRRSLAGSRPKLPPGWVSPEKAAKALFMSRARLMEKVRTGEVRAYRVFRQGPKRVLYGFRMEDLGL